jgi:hypothetical protein
MEARVDQFTTQPGDLSTRETGRLISSDKVEGTTVKNRADETIGSIYQVMIDKHTGKVAYAVMSFGGFLGIGERYHPLPWSTLTYDPNAGAYVVDLDKRTLEGAPAYDRGETVNWEDRAWGQRVHDYYNVPPYWM